MSRHPWNATSTKSRREFRYFTMEIEHLVEAMREKTLDDISDALDVLMSVYEFKNPSDFKNVVMDQAEVIMKHNMRHPSLYDWRTYGSIDFFADPFFRGRKIQLSKLLIEIDTYRENGTMPSQECLEYFYFRDFNHSTNYNAIDKREQGEWE